jgi:hypothetical protein
MALFKELTSDLDLAAERARKSRDNPEKLLPEYFTGARCKLLINDKVIGAALEVSWSVRSELNEVRTIDNFLPTEIVPGQMTITASLKRVVDPRRTLGGDGLYSTITSYLHQPYASIEVRDRMGNVIFLARGMFKDISGSVGNGRLGVESVDFIGYYWRESVNQEFSPSKQDIFSNLVNRVSKNSIVRMFS